MRTDTVFDFLQDCVRNYQSEWKVIFGIAKLRMLNYVFKN